MGSDLKRYTEKRDFRASPEPTGDEPAPSLDRPIYVIQKHDASSLHYDLRLEVDGALKSWAVPKGPSTDPREKRLAIRTEDHPLGYADFEGTIPDDQYGGGTVIVWDLGTFENITGKDGQTKDASDAIEAGHLLFSVSGKKLNGGYALQRIEKDGEREQWLLIKMDDDDADARRNPVSTEPDSVISGQSIETVRKAAEKA